jgi:hypothetical protein
VSGLIVPPPGWTGGANQALVEQTGRVGHFGGVHGVIEAERYDGPGLVVLYVTRVSATSADIGGAAEAEINVLGHPVTARTTQDNAIVVNTAWHDAYVSSTARLVIAARGDHIVAVSGECYVGASADHTVTLAQPVASTRCLEALETLDTGIKPADRTAIPAPSSVPPAPQLTTPGPSQTHVAMPPISVRQEPQTDRRPVYVGAGLIVIAAVFWWNRRRAHV